ncbi:hypothetical protein HPG69_010730 [Diceros bicornis minor]|uniref:Uncharacterized protein n=1 Tax=Diceros bicornis minor TaxID=77932 RepID=A0A7J7EU45_DICBM|nr:hypothetical protein HPG69_010730 [Diceros bicornis minor]
MEDLEGSSHQDGLWPKVPVEGPLCHGPGGLLASRALDGRPRVHCTGAVQIACVPHQVTEGLGSAAPSSDARHLGFVGNHCTGSRVETHSSEQATGSVLWDFSPCGAWDQTYEEDWSGTPEQPSPCCPLGGSNGGPLSRNVARITQGTERGQSSRKGCAQRLAHRQVRGLWRNGREWDQSRVPLGLVMPGDDRGELKEGVPVKQGGLKVYLYLHLPNRLQNGNKGFTRMYNKMWHETQEALNSLLDKESQMIEPQRNQVSIFQMLATYYIKYVQIFRNLENVYDQIVHPQKRRLIRKILDGVMGRILELKNEMVELELTEFHYFDDILQDLNLAPQQLDIPIPKYFLKEKMEVIKGREKILAQILADIGLDVTDTKYHIKGIPLEEAVKVIQIAERARQGRLRATFMKQIFLQEYRAKQARILGERIADVGAAALRIQKVWRGFHQNKKTEREREEEMIFLGMRKESSGWSPQFDSTVSIESNSASID